MAQAVAIRRGRPEDIERCSGNGRVVGIAIGGWDGWRGNIYRLAVLPEYRGRGIVSGLMREVDAALGGLGARRITALVEQDHPRAVGFWNALERADYRRDPTMTRYVKNVLGPRPRTEAHETRRTRTCES